jgi:hypothetical protein
MVETGGGGGRIVCWSLRQCRVGGDEEEFALLFRVGEEDDTVSSSSAMLHL